MEKLRNFFAGRAGIVTVGAAIGVLAAWLQKMGNPPNMGICVACFERDTAGALGLHRASAAQYIRPEIIGFVLGSLAAALLYREFRPRGGSAPLVRFLLGFAAMIGALVFLGCPWRALLRLAGGDGNAFVGLAGLAAGIVLGVLFLRKGFNLGRSHPSRAAAGLMMPLIMTILLLLLLAAPQFGAGGKEGPIFFSASGPGSMHAPLFLSLAAGLLVGGLAQRSRFCTVGAFRDAMLIGDGHLLGGVLAFVGGAALANLAFGQFHPGFTNQPIAHANHLWNFGGMTLAGLAYALAGGCPGRQLFLAGEGDGDAGIFVLGMIAGAAFAHNFSLASSPAGVSSCGPVAVLLGLAFCVSVGLTMREGRR
jgi:YedE family putative selenium metabolism protein